MEKSSDVPVEKRVFRRLLRTVNSQLARDLMGKSDREVAQYQIDPANYHCALAFNDDYALVKYLSKWKGLATGIDTTKVALRSFAAAEEKCAATNRRLRNRNSSIVDPVLHGASRRIAKLLGPFDEWKTRLDGGWGPGATEEFKFPEAYLDRKIADVPFSVTAHAIDEFIAAIKSDRCWVEVLLGQSPCGDFSFTRGVFNVVPGSRITTVEKDAKTKRTIAVEPRGNMFLQKAVGNHVRSLLKRVGVNLDDQSINQQLAADAHSRGLATIDLKSASDSTSIELIYLLFPFEWALYLDKIRSKSYTMGKGYHPFQKLSSMGNGFTFEIESLIFWALTAAVRDLGEKMEDEKRVCAVYGDDIICPQSDAAVLVTVLNYCGFDINLEKSYLSGRFFESCGRHYFDGLDVTPIYQKEIVECELSHIRFYNRLARWALKRRLVHDFEPRFTPVLNYVFGYVRNQENLPLLPLGAEGESGYLVGLNRLASTPSGENVRFCPNRGWKVPTVARARRDRYPANELALYALNLRVRDGQPVSTLLVKGNADAFDGNIECRSDDDTRPFERGTRWVFPTSVVTLD